MEQSRVVWGTTTIVYSIRRSSRRRTVSLKVDVGEGLIVTAPATTPVARLDAIVKSRARWVTGHLRRASELPPPLPARDFVTGETFSYMGRQHRLRLIDEAAPAPMRLRGGWLELPMPKGLNAVHRPGYARAALVDWYKRLAAEHIPSWTMAWAKKIGVTPKDIVLAEQPKRWGSCSRGVLLVNWRVIQAPKTLIDYVLVHELVHLARDDHGRDFWAMVGRTLPDYEQRKERLREMGSTLVW